MKTSKKHPAANVKSSSSKQNVSSQKSGPQRGDVTIMPNTNARTEYRRKPKDIDEERHPEEQLPE